MVCRSLLHIIIGSHDPMNSQSSNGKDTLIYKGDVGSSPTCNEFAILKYTSIKVTSLFSGRCYRLLLCQSSGGGLARRFDSVVYFNMVLFTAYKGTYGN